MVSFWLHRFFYTTSRYSTLARLTWGITCWRNRRNRSATSSPTDGRPAQLVRVLAQRLRSAWVDDRVEHVQTGLPYHACIPYGAPRRSSCRSERHRAAPIIDSTAVAGVYSRSWWTVSLVDAPPRIEGTRQCPLAAMLDHETCSAKMPTSQPHGAELGTPGRIQQGIQSALSGVHRTETTGRIR